ncbi:hypothetical protein AXW84_11370 [Hymenobacter sp. PAMC 26628]|nr:hypothetical protein AXW84_11370 [Hymenobacter sp. PAMC 26628]
MNVYHHRTHKALGMSPYERYTQGILGSPGKPGIGLRPRHQDGRQIYLDFMPMEERTIQREGVVINHFHYYAPELRPFIGSRSDGPGNPPRRFIFKRDPRDLRSIYFLHPTTQIYHQVPLAKMERPAISLWEQREIIRQLLAMNPERTRLTEDVIFKGLDRLEAIQLKAIRTTGKVTKAARRLLGGASKTVRALDVLPAPTNNPAAGLPAFPPAPEETYAVEVEDPAPLALFFSDVTPFDELDNGTSHA